MMRLLKKSVVVLGFVMAFIFCGAMNVKAIDSPEMTNNTDISGQALTYQVGADNYYAIKGSSKDGELTLKSKSVGRYDKVFRNYFARVAIVKCEMPTAEATCDWKVYEFDSTANGGENTANHLLSKKNGGKHDGITLGFDDVKSTLNHTQVYGAELSSLNSVYGQENTYFVVVRYYLPEIKKILGLGGADEVNYVPEVYRVVFTDDIGGIQSIDHISDTAAKTETITVKSSMKITKFSYFASDVELEEGFDFDAKYEEAITKSELTGESKFENGSFVYSVTVNVEDGKHYYFRAEDELGNVEVYDLTNSITSSNEGSTNNNNTSTDPAENKVGKVILIVLLVVLVLAIVLVIVQRIIDYRKKLY